MGKVTKGVIVAAGLGTRFLPATKAVPKELLPVLNKPVLQYIVEEMADSGITDIMIVIAPGKEAIKKHFARDPKLEQTLKKQKKLDRIKSLLALQKKISFHYSYQRAALGNGHALLQAQKFCGKDAFAFSDGDSIIDSSVPTVKQVVSIFTKHHAPIIGVQKISDKQEMTKYGNVYGTWEMENGKQKLYRVSKIVEKPAVSEVSPDGLIIGGMRYIFTPDFWKFLKQQDTGKGGEIWVADAVNRYAQVKTMYAYEYEGTYFDTGNEAALLRTANYFVHKK